VKKNWLNWLTALFVLAFVTLLTLAVRAFFAEYSQFNSENLDRFIRGFGPLSALVYVLAYFLGSPIPFLAPILAAAGGLLFGPVSGTALAIISSTATSLLPFMIARRLGREWVETRLKGTRLDDLLQRANRGSFTFILLLRLVPVMPWELQNYVAGVTQVKLSTFLPATLLGSTPLSVALVILGAAAKQPTSWQFAAALALTAMVLAVPLVIVWVRSRRGRSQKKVQS
jgi:uncharacterized membrane protein YdjX (TVP38/TMEM64 family)